MPDTNMVRTRFGQIFLVDENIAKKIVNSADLTSEDVVVEIGPGKGILTKFIQPQVKHLIAVEIDRDLCKKLKDKFNSCKNLEIVNQDFLTWSPTRSLLNSKPKGLPYIETPKGLPYIETPEGLPYIEIPRLKYIGNLPYYIASPILRKLFGLKNWSLAILTVQKEVGERIVAKPKTKDYGMLSLIAQFYADVKKITKISHGSFYPKPEVDSMVIKFCRKDINYSKKFTDILFEVISAAFKNRRKIIFNSLNLNLEINTKPDTDLKNLLKKVLSGCDIQTNERAEDISLDRYIQLTQSFQKILK